MCGCSGSCTGSCVIDLTGIGQVGETGPQGGYGGYSSLWDFSTTTTTGTTSGQLRFNSATFSSVTSIYVNTTNADGTSVSNFLSSFTNGNYFGKIRIFKKSDSTKFWMGTITASSVSGSEYTLTVSHIVSNSTFANTDEVVMSFSPGAQGAKPLIYSDLPNATTATTGSWATLNTAAYTIPAGTLATDGDYIEVIYSGSILAADTMTEINGVRAILNGSDSIEGAAPYSITGGNELFHHVDTTSACDFEIKIKIIRVSATTVAGYYTTTAFLKLPLFGPFTGGATITVNDLSSSTNTIAPQVYQNGASDIQIFDVKIIKYLQ